MKDRFEKEIFFMKKFICSALAFVTAVTVIVATPPQAAYASEDTNDKIILSDRSIDVGQDEPATFTAALPIGMEGEKLVCVSADTDIATVSPIAYSDNVAAFAVTYMGSGSTILAVANSDNLESVSYLFVNTSGVVMDIPSKLGTNKDNYCILSTYEFAPYDYKYGSFGDYKYTLKLKYQCTSYKDTGYNKWGCYGCFYDADGNEIKKVHLFASSLLKDKVYQSEFDVPVNAVRFSIEGF